MFNPEGVHQNQRLSMDPPFLQFFFKPGTECEG